MHALTVIENVSLSQSHIAKGPEIEARHRLVPAVGIMRLVAGQARLLLYGSGALPALVALMSVCVCDLRCWWHGMAAVCVRHSDVSGVWASLVCKCLFASVGGALALAVVLVWDGACEGEGRAR